MRPIIPKDKMKMRCPNIEEINRINSDEKKFPRESLPMQFFYLTALIKKEKKKLRN